MESPIETPWSPAPYGKACGLFMASVATLIGILREAGPETILLRAAVAGLVSGVAVRLAILTAQYLARNP